MLRAYLIKKKNLIPEINSNQAKKMIDQMEVISGGMIPKINNCLDVAKNGVKAVVLLMEEKITQYFLNYFLIKVQEL